MASPATEAVIERTARLLSRLVCGVAIAGILSVIAGTMRLSGLSPLETLVLIIMLVAVVGGFIHGSKDP